VQILLKLGESAATKRTSSAKLSDAESEAEETRVWLEFASKCGYISAQNEAELDDLYDKILGQLVRMIDNAEQWTIPT
jgi:four helix bundle protein